MKPPISYSRQSSWWECGEKYRLQYVERVPVAPNRNLIIGRMFDDAVSAWLVAKAYGIDLAIEEAFGEHPGVNPNWVMEAYRLFQVFPVAWNDQGWTVLSDQGRPAVQFDLGRAYADALVRTQEGQTLLVDIKTAAQKYPDGFAAVGEQLVDYAMRCARLGIDLDQVGYLVFTKQATVQVQVQIAPVASAEVQAEYAAKLSLTEHLIAQGAYPKRSAAAYNTPCRLCDFKSRCWPK